MYVPKELARRPHWIVWKSITRDGKATKLPFSPINGMIASTSDPSTWSTLDFAQTALATRQYAGVGFVFARGDCLFGVDLDGCLRPHDTIDDWAQEIVTTFGTYAEVSPSKSGLKLFGIGEHQSRGCIKPMGDAIDGGKRPAVEVYGWGRFFAFTGMQFYRQYGELVDCRGPLANLLATMTVPRDEEHRPRQVVWTDESVDRVQRARAYLRKVPPPQKGIAGCNNRTFRAACFLLHELKLTFEECLHVMWNWNYSSNSGWTASELYRKISDALKKGHA